MEAQKCRKSRNFCEFMRREPVRALYRHIQSRFAISEASATLLYTSLMLEARLLPPVIS